MKKFAEGSLSAIPTISKSGVSRFQTIRRRAFPLGVSYFYHSRQNDVPEEEGLEVESKTVSIESGTKQGEYKSYYWIHNCTEVSQTTMSVKNGTKWSAQKAEECGPEGQNLTLFNNQEATEVASKKLDTTRQN